MELATTISVGASVLSFTTIAVITPLIKYVVSSKDKQIDELKALLEKDRDHHCEEEARMRALENQVIRYGSELELTKEIRPKLDNINERVEAIAREMSTMQVQVSFLAKGRIVSVPKLSKES